MPALRVMFMARSEHEFTLPGPMEDAEGAQRDPTARLALCHTRLGVQLVGMYVLQRPPAIRVALGCDEVYRLGQARVWFHSRAAQVVEPPQRVVVIAGGKRELSPGRV